MILRARLLAPVAHPVIDDGAVAISGGRIVAVGAWREVRRDRAGTRVWDLGEAVLMPGLVNAHAHLELSFPELSRRLPRQFYAWIRALLEWRAGRDEPEWSRAWRRGAAAALATGTTTLANVESGGVGDLAVLRGETSLRVFSFLEMTGVMSGIDAGEIMGRAKAMASSLPSGTGGKGFSPHALYSTREALLVLVARVADELKLPVTMHVAESQVEDAMFRRGRGPLYDWLRPMRGKIPETDRSPVEWLDRVGLLGPRMLAVHCNYLSDSDIELLGRSGTQVVHCPRSHRFFEHAPFPCSALRRVGVNLCLGTDSLAGQSIEDGDPDMNMFQEMRTFARTEPGASPREILAMATWHGARALRSRAGEEGPFFPGQPADILVVAWNGPREQVEEYLVHSTPPLMRVMVEGIWVARNPARRIGRLT